MIKSSKSLNIVQIIWEDLGRHLSCYQGRTVISPNIDKMAQEGIMFTNHYSTGPVCLPGRCSIITGRYPHAHELWRFNENEITLPKTLREYGYFTCRFGITEESEFKAIDRDIDVELMGKELLGYDYTWKESKSSMDIANRFCTFIKNELPSRTFFANIAFHDVHRPNEADAEDEEINSTKLPVYLPSLPDTYESKKDFAIFEKRIKKADEAVGKILDFLRSEGLKENTLVYFTTDHGIDFPRAKMTIYDPGIEAALIFWGPEFVPKGKIDDNLHSHVDIFPTLMDVINKPIPDRVQGKSFAEALFGQEYTPREFIIVERAWEAPDDPIRAIRTKKYKYIRNYCPGWPIPIPPEYARKVGSDVIEKIYSNSRPFEELYDIENDPGEMNNLAENKEYREIKNELWKMLESVLIEDDDKVLDLSRYLSYLRELQDGKWKKEATGFKLKLK